MVDFNLCRRVEGVLLLADCAIVRFAVPTGSMMLWGVGPCSCCAGLYCDQLLYSLYHPRNTYPGANLVMWPVPVLTAACLPNSFLWVRSTSFDTPLYSSRDKKVQNWRIQLVCSFCRLMAANLISGHL